MWNKGGSGESFMAFYLHMEGFNGDNDKLAINSPRYSWNSLSSLRPRAKNPLNDEKSVIDPKRARIIKNTSSSSKEKEI